MAVILVVDDNPVHRDLLVDVLRPAGHTVIHASDGAEALRLLDAWEDEVPDLIVSDYNMPKVNGMALIKALREREATRALPILMLTGSAQSIQPFVEAQGVAYLEKGKISSAAILGKIEELLKGV